MPTILSTSYRALTTPVLMRYPDGGATAVVAFRTWRSVTDNVAPVVSVVSPTAGSTLSSSSSAIAIRVKDYGVADSSGALANGTLKRAIVYASFSDSPEEMVWNGTGFTSAYSAGSTATAIAGGYDFSIVRTAGWRTNPNISAYAIDTSGNETNFTTFAWVFTPTPPDTAPPSVASLSPIDGSTLISDASPVTFTLVDGNTGGIVFVFASYSAGAITELVYDNVAGVGALYAVHTTATPAGSNLVFSLRRNNGWLNNPEFRIVATDGSGNMLDDDFGFVFAAPVVMGTSGPPATISFTPDTQAATAADYGSDVLVFPDLDETLTVVNDKRVLAEAMARRLITDKGAMAFHPNYGFNLRRYLNRPLRTPELAEIKAGVEDQCEEDERVLSAECAPEYDFATQTLRIPIEIETAEGPFTMVALVDSLNLTLLASEGIA